MVRRTPEEMRAEFERLCDVMRVTDAFPWPLHRRWESECFSLRRRC